MNTINNFVETATPANLCFTTSMFLLGFVGLFYVICVLCMTFMSYLEDKKRIKYIFGKN